MLGKIYKIQNRLGDLFKKIINSREQRHRLIYITDGADWVIKDIAENITREINQRYKNALPSKIDNTVLGYKNKIIHLGSLPVFGKISFVDASNRIIQTVFHIDKNHGPILEELKRNLGRVEHIHTACLSTKKALIQAGVPEQKIKVIPLGMDLEIFKLASADEKRIIKEKLNLPTDKIIIGSFQKDGNGWGEGLEPKLIKGPDIFCDAVIALAKKFPVYALLTGPARGYVKKRLAEAGVPYTHKYLKNYNDIVPYWQALDLYLITSRIEGGPKAILEAWATGVPLVSTKVGLVPDIAMSGENAILTEVEDTRAIIAGAEQILNNKELQEKLSINGLKEVRQYSWEKIAERYYQELYLPII